MRADKQKSFSGVLCIVLFLGVTSYFLIWHALRIPIRTPFDFNEGWNALQVLKLQYGQPLYSAPDGWFQNNYPPLYFYLLSLAGLLFKDHILTGRVISLMSVIGFGFAVAYCSYTISRSIRSAILAGLFFIAGMMTWYGRYVGMNDPQLLAQFIMYLGLAVLLTEPNRPAFVACGSLLMIIAGFTKHLIVGVPIGLTAFVLLFPRAIATRTWFAAGAVFCLVGLGLCVATFGQDFLSNLLSPREYVWRRAATSFEDLIPCAVPLLAFMFTRSTSNDPLQWLPLFLFFAGTVECIFANTGVGVDINAAFDAFAASCILLGAANITFRTAAGNMITVAVLAGPILLPVLLYWDIGRPSTLRNYQRRAEAIDHIVLALRNSPDPVICEDLAICYWAGKLSLIDPFYAEMAISTGKRTRSELAGLIQAAPVRTLLVTNNSSLRRTPHLTQTTFAPGYVILNR